MSRIQQYKLQCQRCFWHGGIVPFELMTKDHVYVRRNGMRARFGGAWVLACEKCNRSRSGLTIGSLRFNRWLKRVLRGDVRRWERKDHAKPR